MQSWVLQFVVLLPGLLRFVAWRTTRIQSSPDCWISSGKYLMLKWKHTAYFSMVLSFQFLVKSMILFLAIEQVQESLSTSGSTCWSNIIMIQMHQKHSASLPYQNLIYFILLLLKVHCIWMGNVSHSLLCRLFRGLRYFDVVSFKYLHSHKHLIADARKHLTKLRLYQRIETSLLNIE